MKDFFELREGLVKVTDVEFDYRDQLPNSPKTSDIGAISSEWKQDRTALRDAVKKMGGLVTNTVAPSRGNKWVGTVTIGTRDDPKKLDDKSIQKAVKSHGIEIHSNQFRESTDLKEVKVKDFFNLRESLTEDHLKIGQKVKTSDGKVGTVRAAGKGDQKGDYIIAVDGKTMSCNKSDLTVVESTDINENYRTLARAGMGTESKGEARVGLELDYYDGSGTKRMGKITKVTPKGYIVKDEKDGKNRQFTFHDRAKAKEILARLGKGKYNESVEESVDLTEAVTVPRAEFDKLKKGDEVTITYDSSIRKGTTNTFVVKGKSRSAKYNVDKVSMQLKGKPGGMKFFLYSRSGKDATLALGDMGATMTSFKKGS